MNLSVEVQSWGIRGSFAISRGSKTEAEVIVVTLTNGDFTGRGECVPYKRDGETIESVQQQIGAVKDLLTSREELQKLLPAGAARNALDCALWDLECKQTNKTIWQLLGIDPRPMQTMYTISLDTPETMAAKAAEAAKTYSLLKIKLGAEDGGRLQAIRTAAPKARLIADANEGWGENNLEAMIHACESVGVELIEQPLPAESSSVLQKTAITVCADESAHTSEDIPKLVGKYQAVNIKLDKTGGLTEALKMAEVAKAAGLSIMVGCHVSTSLSMAPATVLAQGADYVDLDGPLLLMKDREPRIEYRDGGIVPTTPELWAKRETGHTFPCGRSTPHFFRKNVLATITTTLNGK